MGHPGTDFDDWPAPLPPGPRRGFGKSPLIWSLAGLAVLVLLSLAAPDSRPTTCSVCRVDRVEHAWLGMRWSTLEENDCSRWYREHVEPAHAHDWAVRTHCRRFGLPGFQGYACTIGSPVTGLPRRIQVEVYEHFNDPAAAKPLFQELGRRDGSGYQKFESLMAWVTEGYPGTWPEWWEGHRPVTR